MIVRCFGWIGRDRAEHASNLSVGLQWGDSVATVVVVVAPNRRGRFARVSFPLVSSQESVVLCTPEGRLGAGWKKLALALLSFVASLI